MVETAKYLFDKDSINTDDLSNMSKLVINESIISMLVKIIYKIEESKGLFYFLMRSYLI
jgi:hypothetical protein